MCYFYLCVFYLFNLNVLKLVTLLASLGSVVKNLPANTGDAGLNPWLGRSSEEGNGSPLQYSCLGNPMDRRSLVGYSPWSHKSWALLNEQQYHFII